MFEIGKHTDLFADQVSSREDADSTFVIHLAVSLSRISFLSSLMIHGTDEFLKYICFNDAYVAFKQKKSIK